MKKEISALDKFSPLNTDRLRKVLVRRNVAWDFVKTEHTASDTKTMLEDVRNFGAEVTEEVFALLNYQKAHPKHTAQVENLLDRYETINAYLREIQDCLTSDFDQKQREAEAKKFDWIKNVSAVLTIPGIFVTGVKNGVGHGLVSIDQALISGFAISIPTVFHKNFKTFFSQAARNVCAAPQIAKNDIRVYYAREIFKEKKLAVTLSFATAAKAINDNVEVGVRTVRGIKKIFGRGGPQP